MTITNVTDKEIARATELRTVEARKDAAYLERNQLVALLSKLFPAGKRKTAIEGWSEDWHGCVYIDLPTGQASWHYHDSQAHLFDHLPEYQGAYDGHTTEQKYQRIAGYVEPKPKAWAIFTGDGNARMWSTYRPHVQKLAVAEGLKITALYAEMPAPARADVSLTNEGDMPQFMGFGVAIDPTMAPNEMKLVQPQAQGAKS